MDLAAAVCIQRTVLHGRLHAMVLSLYTLKEIYFVGLNLVLFCNSLSAPPCVEPNSVQFADKTLNPTQVNKVKRYAFGSQVHLHHIIFLLILHLELKPFIRVNQNLVRVQPQCICSTVIVLPQASEHL